LPPYRVIAENGKEQLYTVEMITGDESGMEAIVTIA
jgi:hypothetical protein